MKTLDSMVQDITLGGNKKVEAEVLIDVPYEATCYRVGGNIRIDLKPKPTTGT
jgi:hypothetical protein